MQPPAHIVHLTAENVKRIKVVNIHPGGSPGVVTIGGANGAGKSSVLDSIEMLFAGGRAIPPQPINEEEVEAAAGAGKKPHMRIVAKLSNGLVVTRARRGDADTIQVENAEGAVYRTPQAILNSLFSAVAFDPLEFTRMKPADQRATLIGITGLDLTQFDRDRDVLHDEMKRQQLAAAEAQRALATNDQTMAAVMKQLRPEIADEDLPTSEIDIEQLKNSVAWTLKADDDRRAVDALLQKQLAALDVASKAMADADERVAILKRRLEEAERVRDSAKQMVDAADARVKETHTRLASMPAIADTERAALMDGITKARDANALFAIRMRREQVRTEHAAKIKDLVALIEAHRATEAELKVGVAAVDQQRKDAIAAAKFPVPGLGFDNDGVLFEGRPFEQASQAEKLRASVAIGMALNPALRVMLVREGALLDDKSMALLGELAAEQQAQVWVERVGDDGHNMIVMEDGSVAIDRTQEVK